MESTAISSPAGSRSATSAVIHAPGHEALQALLAFSSLHEQIRKRRALERSGEPLSTDVWELEQFVFDEVLQLVAERALPHAQIVQCDTVELQPLSRCLSSSDCI
jgi:hypothetical protein